ncbi:glycosyltransferase [Bradyrhizobium sp. CCGUVB23]|uniref:glycosyltransferase n=1 Tax=Bradyrhizobium sp. CCGUVB23 TaxID=2949630 RepID=UPI0020B2FEAB|nr:glycosyltransferase [Bradyrhizobium sp. CCGUVB23]MCP3460061.1 glycosyltransferase [Bradyrhizobium sp. CCGUVB23]
MPSQKTVLVYRNELLPISETFIKEQLLALRQWRPVLVGRRILEQLPLDNLDVRIVGPQKSTLPTKLSWKFRRALGLVPTRAINELKAEDPLLVHAHFGMDALDAWPIARALRVPMLVSLHGYDINTHREWWEAGHGGTRMRLYPRRVLSLAQQPAVSFVAVSNALRRRAIEYGIPAKKIAVSYIGINTRTFRTGTVPISQRPLRVVFVGRLVEKKGCDILIEAMSHVQQVVTAAQLTVIGDGPLRHDLESLATRKNVPATFRGAQSSAYVKRELDASRVLCLPSITASNGDAEGFGLVLLEAQASGVPVVTSALGGATEGISERITGFSFAERDIEGLARILINVLTNDAMLRQMADNGPSYVATHFDLARCTDELELLYDKISSDDLGDRRN